MTFLISNIHIVWSNADYVFEAIEIGLKLHEEVTSKRNMIGERL